MVSHVKSDGHVNQLRPPRVLLEGSQATNELRTSSPNVHSNHHMRLRCPLKPLSCIMSSLQHKPRPPWRLAWLFAKVRVATGARTGAHHRRAGKTQREDETWEVMVNTSYGFLWFPDGYLNSWDDWLTSTFLGVNNNQ